MNKEAADAMKVTSLDLNEMGIADEIIKEPLGGAHHDYDESAQNLKQSIIQSLLRLRGYSSNELIKRRSFKFEKI